MKEKSVNSLVCRMSRIWSFLILFVGAVFAFISIDAIFFNWLLPSKGALLTAFMVLILLFSLLALYIGLQMMIHPTMMLEADDRGIQYHYRTLKMEEKVFLIPWDRILKMEYLKTTAHGGAQGTVLVRAVKMKLKIEEGDEFQIPEGANYFKENDDDGKTFYIDTVNPSPGGVGLFNTLVEMHEKFRS